MEISPNTKARHLLCVSLQTSLEKELKRNTKRDEKKDRYKAKEHASQMIIIKTHSAL